MAGRSEQWIRRFIALGADATCASCGQCTKGRWCEASRRVDLRTYTGIRITNDGNDCALPLVIDSHSHCAFGCAYCFSENSFGHVKGRDYGLGQTPLRAIQSIFAGGGGKQGDLFRAALRYDHRNRHGFPAPVQLGGINDPCDNIERQQGWLLRFLKLCIRYNQPVRISTKGTVLLERDYQKVIAQAPHLFWIMVSIVTPDEQLAAKVERHVPSPKQRIRVIEEMTKLGCFTGLRFRPVVPGMSDRTPRFPVAYKTLIDWAADAGAKAMEYEIVYVPMRFHGEQKERWERMERDIGVPLRDVYMGMGPAQASLRPSAQWMEDIVHAIHHCSKQRGLIVGISEPSWKELNDDGCCCGMVRTHPVFGNYEPKNFTQALVNARDTGKPIELEDVTPEWAHTTKMSLICNIGGAGPLAAYNKRHLTYAEFIANDWRNQRSTRNPLTYFQGALKPIVDGKDVKYEFVGQKRRHPALTPFWEVAREHVEGTDHDTQRLAYPNVGISDIGTEAAERPEDEGSSG